LVALHPDKAGPMPARLSTINWTATVTGGSGYITYEFRTMIKNIQTIQQRGGSPVWEWQPKQPGIYRVKVIAVDEAGHRMESDWSPVYAIYPPLSRNARLALLPIENLSDGKAPLNEIGKVLAGHLKQIGFRLLDPEVLAKFMKRYRIRYTGGVSSTEARAILEETGAEALFITSLEEYTAADPPKISLMSRLVSSGGHPQILWIDSTGLSGDDSPGLLGVGYIKKPRLLLEKAARQLIGSLDRWLTSYPEKDALKPAEVVADSSVYNEESGDYDIGSQDVARFKDKYLPHMFFRSSVFEPRKKYLVAVVPFLNLSSRKKAGQILTLHHVKQMFQLENFTVVEPGVVREKLLKFRAIMTAGPSLAVADLLTDEELLGVDLVLSGKVFDYQGKIGTAKVDFSAQMIEKQSREVVFISRSYGAGDDGVYFYDIGRVRSAHNLTEKMAKTSLQLLVQ